MKKSLIGYALLASVLAIVLAVPAVATYATKIYKKDGGNTMVVASGGEIDIESGGVFKIGATALTATAAELNLNDDLPASFTFTPAAGGANVCEVTIQAKDAAGVAMTRACLFLVYLSDASTGIGITGTTASGAVTAKASSGTDFGALTAKKVLLAQSKTDGTFILSITDTEKTGFYVCAVPLRGGAPSVSAVLVSDNYGA